MAPFQKSIDFRQSPIFVILTLSAAKGKNPRICGNALNLWILRLLPQAQNDKSTLF